MAAPCCLLEMRGRNCVKLNQWVHDRGGSMIDAWHPPDRISWGIQSPRIEFPGEFNPPGSNFRPDQIPGDSSPFITNLVLFQPCSTLLQKIEQPQYIHLRLPVVYTLLLRYFQSSSASLPLLTATAKLFMKVAAFWRNSHCCVNGGPMCCIDTISSSYTELSYHREHCYQLMYSPPPPCKPQLKHLS